jgi:hypothetical protein
MHLEGRPGVIESLYVEGRREEPVAPKRRKTADKVVEKDGDYSVVALAAP